MLHIQTLGRAAFGIAIAAALMPGAAYAFEQAEPLQTSESLAAVAGLVGEERVVDCRESRNGDGPSTRGVAPSSSAKGVPAGLKAGDSAQADKLLSYDRSLIDEIGTQEKSGHTICCPSFSCAYADAVLDGTVHDHGYYTCSCCTWTDWGGGGSSDRCVGTDEELLREAYDQISAGKPTVIHVAASYGEHWIALIGYHDVEDPDHLSLSSFTALDPWDGAQINPADRFTLFGDGCEHVSSR